MSEAAPQDSRSHGAKDGNRIQQAEAQLQSDGAG